MNKLKVVSSAESIRKKLSKIINRTDIESYDKYAENTIREMYLSMIKNGDFNIESLIELSQSHDESLLYEIAEEYIRSDQELQFLERLKEQYGDDTYDDMIDKIVNEYIVEYGIMLFLSQPPYCKSTIPYNFSAILDKIGGSFCVQYPPEGSFEAYIDPLRLMIYFNDCQNSLCEECAVHDSQDHSRVNVMRKLNETIRLIN